MYARKHTYAGRILRLRPKWNGTECNMAIVAVAVTSPSTMYTYIALYTHTSHTFPYVRNVARHACHMLFHSHSLRRFLLCRILMVHIIMCQCRYVYVVSYIRDTTITHYTSRYSFRMCWWSTISSKIAIKTSCVDYHYCFSSAIHAPLLFFRTECCMLYA